MPRIRRWTLFWLWCAGLLLAAAAAVALFLSTLDADVYRRAVERQLTSALQRTVSIERMSVRLSLTPTLGVQGLRIANPPGTSRPDFATAASGDVRVDLLALWDGHIVLQAVHLQNADLLFERDAQGAGNWVFGAPSSEATEKAKPQLPDFEAISVTDSRIAWRRADGSLDAVQVTRFEATVREGAPFTAQGQLNYRDTALRVTLKSDDSLVSALNGKPPHLSLVVEPKGASLTLDAKLASLTSLNGAELKLELKGERLDAWSGLAGQALPALGPYRLAARTRYADATLQIDDWQLALDGLPMQPTRIQVDGGKAVLGEQAETQFSATGKLADTPFTLQARSVALPQLRQLLQSADSTPITLQATLGQLAAKAEGKFAITKKDGFVFDLATHAKGDALVPVRLWTSLLPGPALPADMTGRLVYDRRGFAAKNLRGQALGSALSGELAYVHQPKPLLSGSATAARLDIAHPAFQSLFKTDPKSPPAKRPLETAWSLRVGELAGLPLPVTDVATDLSWRNGTLGLKSLSASVAGTELGGEAAVRWKQGRAQIDGKLQAALYDLARPCSACAPAAAGNPLDAALPMEAMRLLDANLEIAIARVAGAALPLTDIAAQARLLAGRLDLDVSAAHAADIPLQGHLLLDASGSAMRVALDAKAERLDLAALLRALKQPASVDGVIPALQIAADAQGDTLRTLLAQTRLSVRSAPFSLAWGRERKPLSVEQVSLDAAPGGPLLANASGRAFDAPLALAITGGPLAELLDQGSAWPTITAQLTTALEGQSLQIAARTGPLRQLLAMRDVPLSLQATMPGAQASLDGTLSRLSATTATPLAVRVDIANLGQTAALFKQPGLPALPVKASGRATLGDGALSIDGLAAQVGRSDASGRLQVRWQERPRLSADLSAKLIDITEWLSDDETGGTPLLDRPIATKPLQAQDLHLHLRAESFVLPWYTLGKLEADATLESGLIVLKGIAADGNLQADLRFDTAREVPAGALRLSLKDMDTQALYTEATGRRNANAPHLSSTVQLAGAGTKLREVFSASQGEVLITAGPGTLPSSGRGLGRMAGNILEILAPGRQRSDLRDLECAAARFTIDAGVATSTDGIALRFKPLDILGGGAINLESGQILFGYRAVRRKWLSFSVLGLTSGVAQIGGTLAHPTAELNPSGVLVTGTAAWATMGLSLLAGDLWRKFEATEDPCVRIAAGADRTLHPLDTLIRALPQIKLPFPPASTSAPQETP